MAELCSVGGNKQAWEEEAVISRPTKGQSLF